MPIRFKPNLFIEIEDYEIELDFKTLGIDNIFIYMTKCIEVRENQIFFLNEKKKILGIVNFENGEKAVNFFNFTAFMIGYKVIFKDKFAVKED